MNVCVCMEVKWDPRKGAEITSNDRDFARGLKIGNHPTFSRGPVTR